MEIKKGLDGVIADTSAVSKVMPESNSLTYRGYPVQELAESCSFESVAYLLLFGELPTDLELKEFKLKEASQRAISSNLLQSMKLYPLTAHPMDTLRTAVSYQGLEDTRIFDISENTNIDKAIKLLATIPTMIATYYRLQKGLPIIEPNKSMTISENFFNMCFGKTPPSEILKAFEVSLILYAEHSFNASTFTARGISSTNSDFYSSITGAIGSLKGPLHGGANEQVMRMLLEIETPEKAHLWIEDALSGKNKIMGFGHRVYKRGDSRVPTMKKYAASLGEYSGQKQWKEISDILENQMVSRKNIYPNLDFPAGPAYYLMGFEIDMFTPIFVMARITGWSAHVIEQCNNNRIIRPLCEYIGKEERHI